MSQSAADIAKSLATAHTGLRHEIRKRVVGQDATLDLMMLALLCGGHALLLGVPGVGKTLMAATMAKALKLDFRRVQFTPDLMPADITGAEVLEEDPVTRSYSRRFLPGPIFTNFLLADEINRTPPKTQAALLQAMQEKQVSIGRETYTLKPPFVVLATQNPIEMEGTYPLPEAQLDRFLFCIRVSYPTEEEEMSIVRETTTQEHGTIEPVMTPEEIVSLQALVRGVPVADDVVRHAVRLVGATRPNTPAAIREVTDYLEVGASPRASQTLILASKARALLAGRVHVDFADVRALALPVLRHRLVLNFKSRAEGLDADALINRLLEKVPTP
ncbi:MAG: MoxR family ATPase [Luteolibacter sp.]|uniref:AAA family ATPase n=1 Tax=Luteolibacter sp. TaxID=1962973 RepID=UPI0032661635